MKTKVNSFDALFSLIEHTGYSSQTTIASNLDSEFCLILKTRIKLNITNHYAKNKSKALQFKALGSFLGLTNDSIFMESVQLTTDSTLKLLKELNY